MSPGSQLLDHLVGAGDQHGRHLEAKRLGGLEIDDELEAGGLLDRQLRRIGALDDLVDVDAHCREQAQCVTRAPNTAKPSASPHCQSQMRLQSALQSKFKQST